MHRFWAAFFTNFGLFLIVSTILLLVIRGVF